MDSLIPLLFNELGDIQRAIDAATEEIDIAIRDFETAAAALLHKYADHASRNDLEKMIIGCQYACTANVTWR